MGKWIEGSPDSYEKVATRLGWHHFDLGEDYDNLKALTDDDEMWKVNKQFLDNCKANNKTIYLKDNPFDKVIVGFGSGYDKEINYIKDVLGGQIGKDETSGMWKVIFF